MYIGNGSTSERLKCIICEKATSDYVHFVKSGINTQLAHCQQHLDIIMSMKDMIANHINFLTKEINRVK